MAWIKSGIFILLQLVARVAAWPVSGDSSTTSPPSSLSSGGDPTPGYLQVNGTKVVDPNGNTVILRGTNLGGWLVFEDWMCGITDQSGNNDREPQVTLESRFNITPTKALIDTWQNNWITSADFDNMKSLGFNLVRVPFSYRNFKWSNGSYIKETDAFSRLDWAVAQAKSRGMYLVLDFHVWEGQIGQGSSNYSIISQPGAVGQAQRNLASAIWSLVAQHYVGEPTIAAYDVMNEPTGSPGDILQIDMYNAIRPYDPDRIIIMESVSANPASHGWTNVMYSFHEYDMEGSNFNKNKKTYQSEVGGYISQSNSFNIPSYVGEFMTTGRTLTWMLQQMDASKIWWSGWTYTTVSQGNWGLYNFGSSMDVDVSTDSYATILSKWSNMGAKSVTSIASLYKAGATA